MQAPKRHAHFNFDAAPADIPVELDRWEFDMRDYAMDMATTCG